MLLSILTLHSICDELRVARISAIEEIRSSRSALKTNVKREILCELRWTYMGDCVLERWRRNHQHVGFGMVQITRTAR
jgi:hypothetical protein